MKDEHQLAGEVATLRAENEQLELEVAAWRQASDLKAAEIERLNTGIYTLSIENERLRAALLEIEREATAWKPPRYSWFGERARRALGADEAPKKWKRGDPLSGALEGK